MHRATASVLTISGLSPALGSLSGIAIDGAGNLYITDPGHNRVVKVSPSGAGSASVSGSVNADRSARDSAGPVRRYLYCRYGQQPDR